MAPPVNFVQSVSTVYSKYATFSGRAIRSEFWWYMLFYAGISVVLAFVPVLGDIWGLANLLPSMAVTARRLHDTDRTGWWQVLPILCLPVLLPGYLLGSLALMIVGGLIAAGLYVLLIVWLATPGTPGPNRFGNDPMGRYDAEVFD